MRNAIQYYYGIEVENIRYENKKYYFEDYILIPVYKKINLDIYNYLETINLNNYEIIQNKESKEQTIIDNSKYILLKRKINLKPLNLNSLEKNSILMSNKKIIDWDVLWEQKVDYYEKHVKTILSNKLKKYFHYYVGLTENAIMLYKMIKSEENTFLAHIRLSSDEDYLNPLNYVVDYRVRDIAEYIKNLFFSKKLILNDIFLYLSNNKYTKYEYMLLFVRLLYPSYFFDVYDLIVQGEDESLLDRYINEIDNYETLLRNIYLIFRQYIEIPKIEWLINKKELSNDNSILHPYQ